MFRDFAEPQLVWLKVIGVLLVAAGVFYGGYALRGMKSDREIAKIQAERATERADANASALASLKTDMQQIHLAASQSAADAQALQSKLHVLAQERKSYVSSHPLPVDCVPDSVRLQQLEKQRQISNDALSAP